MEISASNQLRGVIVAVETEGLMAEVRILVGDQEVTAIITRASVERLGLQPGQEALAVIKSTEVMVAHPTPLAG